MVLNLIQIEALTGIVGQHALYKFLELVGEVCILLVSSPELLPPSIKNYVEVWIGNSCPEEGHFVCRQSEQGDPETVEVSLQRVL